MYGYLFVISWSSSGNHPWKVCEWDDTAKPSTATKEVVGYSQKTWVLLLLCMRFGILTYIAPLGRLLCAEQINYVISHSHIDCACVCYVSECGIRRSKWSVGSAVLAPARAPRVMLLLKGSIERRCLPARAMLKKDTRRGEVEMQHCLKLQSNRSARAIAHYRNHGSWT